MKKLIIAVALLITANLSAQSAIEKVHFKIEINSKIEIDGHIFDNKKSKDPIVFEATLDGIKIHNKISVYQKRKCNETNCGILHLEPKFNGSVINGGWIGTNPSFLSSN